MLLSQVFERQLRLPSTSRDIIPDPVPLLSLGTASWHCPAPEYALFPRCYPQLRQRVLLFAGAVSGGEGLSTGLPRRIKQVLRRQHRQISIRQCCRLCRTIDPIVGVSPQHQSYGGAVCLILVLCSADHPKDLYSLCLLIVYMRSPYFKVLCSHALPCCRPHSCLHVFLGS